jgi:PEP-CTERM motif
MSRTLRILGLAVFVLLAFTRVGQALPILSFETSTQGCFNCTSADLGLTDTMNDVTFTGTTLETTSTPGGSGLLTLGHFSRGNANQTNPFINQFLLEITFIVPSGVNGSPDEYTALVTANSQAAPLSFNFDNTPVTYSFSNGSGSGQFTFAMIDPAQVPKNSSNVILQAQITNADFTPIVPPPPPPAVPEPASLVLFASGIAGWGLQRCRKRV